ncbi:isoeugenol synthase 1-like isoform X2 [Tripterygium wilfordii]|uniref:isoeugenol synthase 1-like isoform X2 n=1 Tax=Tripterygium wilfordii TaxID=458696 RepID=UPI0018F7EE40|nr:isoeugenol synthase 1-like isoform X2 [Tripterygium wilfordii]XP_038726157.1 isoeugenol synthase 1-like isoform X2 [Tripterygium wilfordii]
MCRRKEEQKQRKAMAHENKILIIGATGYLGKFMVKASVSMGHPTYAYVRPIKPDSDPSKLKTHEEFRSMGVSVFQGELDDHGRLVSALRQVDVVISTVGVPQYLHQLNIISAVKEVGTIKRFVPSEYGNEVDRVSGLPPFEALSERKRKKRRATEAAGLSYTYVSANSFAAYFIDYFLHPRESRDNVVVYAVLNYEEDVAAYTVKAATDPRTANSVVICRPSNNIVSQLDLISMWETKTGHTCEKVYVHEDELIKLTQTLPYPENIPAAVLHNIFIQGDQMSFELSGDDLEASKLYPDYNYTCVDGILDICLVNPPKPKLATLA